MINLSPRLAAIGNEIKKGETMADIGTDHGLPVSLWERGISPKVIMADVSAGSLDKARDNCCKLHPETEFDLRLGDGLQVIENGEVDDVVLAGMGGILMTEILENDLEKTWSFKKLILQPRTHVGILRHWLLNHSFSIINEQLVREGKYICEIITAVPKEIAVSLNMDSDRVEYQYPRQLLDYKSPLLEEYLLNKLELEKRILAGIESSAQPDPRAKRSQNYKIEYLTHLIKQCKIV